jgi:hypothetical protein
MTRQSSQPRTRVVPDREIPDAVWFFVRRGQADNLAKNSSHPAGRYREMPGAMASLTPPFPWIRHPFKKIAGPKRSGDQPSDVFAAKTAPRR